ncbi:MAG: hypothetical protein GC136_01205 [Alphaproteobacteria bacterium]|nr:hypothetical protein [Alphaproteobacteria bacterium]
MRQQYHMVRTESGEKHVWDVNRLVEEVKGLPIIDVPLSEIAELDESYWHEEGGWKKPIARDIALHAKLIYETDLAYPIILHADGRIMDGMHRCCKALILGHKTIKAIKFEQDPAPHFINPKWEDLPYNDNFQDVLRAFGLPTKD